ncbi:MAG: hypothetical protein R3E08_09475 [Thiotrichaceae bacterium]
MLTTHMLPTPWETAPADYLPPLEMARGISYGFYQIQDGRPMQDGESSPNSHLYRKGYETTVLMKLKIIKYFVTVLGYTSFPGVVLGQIWNGPRICV